MYIVQTQRLGLRKLTQNDFDFLYAMFNDRQVMRYYPGLKDRAETQRWIDWLEAGYARYGYALFAVERLADGALLGQCGPMHMEIDGRPDIEVGYLFAREFWGAGYATEAARAAKRWAFEHHAPDRVVSFIDPRNEPSIAVARRNGMQPLKRLEAHENRWKKPVLIYGVYADEEGARL